MCLFFTQQHKCSAAGVARPYTTQSSKARQFFVANPKSVHKSFERLEAQGRIEEATFVLAELLKNNAEAVDFLAKHGRYRLAAELAEARNLPKETIVRQWYLAGEKMRAVRLAILHNCFEYAVTKLEQENSETGAELREVSKAVIRS